MTSPKKHIAILGSTGSIGTQTLEVVREQSDYFQIEVLVANNNAPLLIQQAQEFRPNVVVIGNENLRDQIFSALDPLGIKVYTGAKSIEWVVQMETVDMVVTAMVGYAGLIPTIKAIQAGKNIALANKETLVVAGDIITKLAKEKGVNIYPVDSEHSAIFQCLVGELHNPINKIILTASGGPFRGKNEAELGEITKQQALRHPKWEMGSKITIDSATMMNKGLEVIEAKWLFHLPAEKIEVWVHPQSIVHSMVQFEDGTIKAQMGLPDMKLPIQYALSYPKRLASTYPKMNLSDCMHLEFEKPDTKTFRNLNLAYTALRRGGSMPCILNAANEVAVQAFLEDRIGFLNMSDLIETCMENVPYLPHPTLEDYIATDRETRQTATSLLRKISITSS